MKKVAIVYDRVNKWGGAERVLLALHELFPKAPLYTSVYDSKKATWAKVFPKVVPSFLQKIPFAKSNHELLAPFVPLAFYLFDFSKYDLVISVTSEAAKNIRTKGRTMHICYCLTPTRYLWSGYKEYFRGSLVRSLTKPIVSILKIWDRKSSDNPNRMIAISTEVQTRIKKYYDRDSIVIYPPVDTVGPKKHKEPKFYLLVSRLDYGYKKVDLAIKAFNKMNKPLVVVGAGREEKKLKSIANRNIVFAGRVDESKLADFYRNAKALIMPQEEDFGIVSVEAQSFGVPVIAFKKGGAADTVIDRKTGVLFEKQNVPSIVGAITKFERLKFDTKALKTNAKRFSKEMFHKKFLDFAEKMLN